MNQIVKVEKLVSLLFLLIFTGCSAYGKEKAPYIVSGDLILSSETSDYEIAGIDLYFFNKSEKKVLGFTVVFYLFDEDGEPITTGKNNIVLSIQENVDAMSSSRNIVGLDKYFIQVPESDYAVDFMYISQIIYEDGTTWKDSLGLMAF